MESGLARSTAPGPDRQAQINRAFWSKGTTVRSYANRVLRPVEVVLLALHRDALAGRVLDLGCGAGRLTGYLIAIGGRVTGLDISPAMVAHCRRQYPEGDFIVGDLEDLSRFEDGCFDAVVASYNVLDVLGHDARKRVLRDVRRVLAPGGLLIMSSHNRAARALWRPAHVLARNPLRVLRNVARLGLRVRNHRRLRAREQQAPEYAILNDPAHQFALLHYYIEPDAQSRQLEALGYEVLERYDLEGRSVAAGEPAPWSSDIHYVARSA